MKKTLLFFALFSFLFVNGQYKKNSLYNKGIIHFKEGYSKDGLIKVRSLGGIKFKENENSKPKSYGFEQLIGYDIVRRGGTEKYKYKKIVGNDIPFSMKIVQLGKINLYSITAAGTHFISNGNGGMMSVGSSIKSIIYYLEKDNKIIRIGNRIKKKVLPFLNDCSILIEKIEKKEINKKNILVIINFYNRTCG